MVRKPISVSPLRHPPATDINRILNQFKYNKDKLTDTTTARLGGAADYCGGGGASAVK